MAQFVISLIVARLLSPSEIGIYSIAVVLVNIAHVFRDFGVSTYLQREAELTSGKVRSAMGVAYAIAWFIAFCIFVSSGMVSRYFGYSEIQPVMHILAISFLFIPFSSVALALLLREYDATKIAWGAFWGTFAYAVVCLGLAYTGHGAQSLAWANLANVLATGITYLWLKPLHMYYLPRFRELGGIIRFGGGALATNLIKSVNDALPDLILGKIGSARQVGLVSRANSTVNIFIYVAGSAMNFGSQSYFAKAHHSGQPLAPMLHRSIGLVTGVGWPTLAITAIAAQDIVVGLYSDIWLDAVPVVTPLALMASIGLMFYYHPATFNAIGRPYLAAIPLLITALSRIVLTVVLFSGNIVSFGWALALATLATMPVWLILQKKHLKCKVVPLFAALLPSAIVTLCTGIVGAVAIHLIHQTPLQSPIIRVLVMAIPVAIAWLLSLRLLRHPLYEEMLIVLSGIVSRLKRPA
ncbi:oligosaccharide flippase family protein [Altererythrobacter indicus]|uniref:Oligosaccharide flippase family protein n=2 Tax=Altericroceibacterium indicum TaxID=374177 RepID=A0A845A8N5_9SPHN|nr:oligosaccharide flippase family protein [Altericroceibacterium indicum]